MFPMLMLTGFLGVTLPEDVVDQMVSQRVVVVERQVMLNLRVCTGDPLGSLDDKTLRVISQPTLSVRHKQTGFFQATGSDQAGVTFRATPRLRLDGKIDLACETTIATVTRGRGIQTAAGFTPGLDSKTVKTATILTPGKTVKVRLESKSATDQTWIELRAEVVEPGIGNPLKAEPARMVWATYPQVVAVDGRVVTVPTPALPDVTPVPPPPAK